MIKNERQYRITKAQVGKFERALNEVSSREGVDPLLAKLETDALRSQLEELQQQLEEYEALRSGECGIITVESFKELPQALVRARIALGLSQKVLAERLGMKEQQLQRYEATDYQSASVARMRAIVDALGVSVREEVVLPAKATSVSALFDRLRNAGIDRDFVRRRLLPPALAERILDTSRNPTEVEITNAATILGRVFKWGVAELFATPPLRLQTEAAGIARFKIPAGANERKVSAYTVYAHYLALLILQATPDLEPCPVPTDANEFREAILAEFGTVTFEHVLRFLWNLGIPVLPLSDAGSFHGAFWRVDGRNIIVLKQRTLSNARWTSDCLHETYHAGQEPNQAYRTVIEESEMSPERRDSAEEQEATRFAGDVMLDGRAEELAQMCVHAAGGRVDRLKNAVQMVADTEDIELGALANYMAFRLSLQDVNWWGAATNLQSSDSNPWEIARDWLLPRLQLDRLIDIDRQILLQALTTMEK
ncbi:MAG: helix-turn-helix domain-containing protein [Pirellulaceae bacterium]|nr:helix-turn-helix domain-containing protein [Pirellulaceae bacterium]